MKSHSSPLEAPDSALGIRQDRKILAFLIVVFLAWSLRATVFYRIDLSIDSAIARSVYSSFLKFALWVVPAAAFAYWIRRRPALEYLGITAMPDKPTWMACLGVIGGFLAIVAGFELTAGGKSFTPSRLLALSPVLMLLHHFFSPLVEEVLFRGLVMKEFMARMSTARANILTSLLFVGVHLPYWLWSGAPTSMIAVNSYGILLFSLVAGWTYARSASIWPPTVAHIANNLLAAMLVASSGG